MTFIRRSLLLLLLVTLTACSGEPKSPGEAAGDRTAPAPDTPAAAKGESASDGSTYELVVWHAYRGNEKKAFEKVAGMFDEQTGSISVKTLAVPYDAYADRITAAVPRGRGPDVFIFAQDRLGGWVVNGSIMEPIDFFVDDETRALFLPKMLDAVTFRDTLYGLPFNYKSIALFYNKALVSEPPKTSSELVSLAKSLTDVGSNKFGLVYTYSDYWYHAALMNAFGGGVFDPGPVPTVDRPENIAAVKQMMKWYKEDGILPDDPSTAVVTSLFNSGATAMVFSGPWFIGEIDPAIDFAIAVLPVIEEAANTPMKPWMTVEGIYINQGSGNKDAAFAFSRYLVSEPAARVMALEGSQLPANKNVYSDPEVANDPILSVFRLQAENAVPMPNYAEMSSMWSPVTTAMNKITRGSATPEAALAEAQAALVESIEAMKASR